MQKNIQKIVFTITTNLGNWGVLHLQRYRTSYCFVTLLLWLCVEKSAWTAQGHKFNKTCRRKWQHVRSKLNGTDL